VQATIYQITYGPHISLNHKVAMLKTAFFTRITRVLFDLRTTDEPQQDKNLGTSTSGFFIKDRIASGGLRVVHCPTSVMLANFYAKPLQGALFKRFRAVILGYDHISSLEQDYMTSPDKERVGEGRPGAEQGEGEDETSKDLEWTMVTRRGGAGAKESVVNVRTSTCNETEQSNEYSEKYREHLAKCSYFENNPIIVQVRLTFTIDK
jgi:hypothetical protein